MKKMLSINRFTGIDARSSIGTPDHPIVNRKQAPSITDLHEVFVSEGIPLSVSAGRKALDEAGIDPAQITHIVATTCTDSANPGFDHYVAKQLGITHNVEKVLLHGIGCSGGLATLRTAANLALGHTARGKPARILCLALEVSTTMVRSEMDSINESQDTRIGIALFSDCGSAVVLSNGIGPPTEPVYDLLGWEHRIIPNSDKDLGFDVDVSGMFTRKTFPRPTRELLTRIAGWKVVLSPRVPALASSVMAPTFADLLASVPSLPAEYQKADDFDWAMHPGGATILTGAEKAMGISSEHMRASYDTYINHGNSSSATIFSVLDRLRSKDMDALAPGGRVRDFVVGCAFGPGITAEMCMLKRNRGVQGVTGLLTPPETESEGGRSDAGDDIESPAAAAPQATGEAFVAEALEQLDLD